MQHSSSAPSVLLTCSRNECGVDVQVTLVVPWLTIEEQSIVMPDGLTFSRPEQQEAHLKEVSAAPCLW